MPPTGAGEGRQSFLNSAKKNLASVRNKVQVIREDAGAMAWIGWWMRALAFLVYAISACALLSVSSRKSPCYVQSTYKQEFLAKIISNPFYSSSHVLKRGPPSMYEVRQNFSAPYKQQASDLGMFPVVPNNPLLHSAFWPVEAMPQATQVAGVSMPGQRALPISYLVMQLCRVIDHYVIEKVGMPGACSFFVSCHTVVLCH